MSQNSVKEHKNLEFIKNYIEDQMDAKIPDEKGLNKISWKLLKIPETYKTIESVQELSECCLRYVELIVRYAHSLKEEDLTENRFTISRYLHAVSQISGMPCLRNVFVEATSSLFLEQIIDPSLKTVYGKELLRTFNMIINNSDITVREAIAGSSSKIYMYKLADMICVCGDFEFQSTLLEVIFRMCSRELINTSASEFFPEAESLQHALVRVDLNGFDRSCRQFLNSVNMIFGNVYSIVADEIYLDKTAISGPVDNLNERQKLWVDFNKTVGTIGIYCDRDSMRSAPPSEDSDTNIGWELITLFRSDVGSIRVQKRTTRSNKMSTTFCFEMLRRFHVLFISSEAMARSKYISFVVDSEDDVQKMKCEILPNIFPGKYKPPASSSNLSSRAKSPRRTATPYTPLKVWESKRNQSKSVASESKSVQSLTECITGKIWQAEMNQSKSIASADSKSVKSMVDVLNPTGKIWQAEPNQSKSVASVESTLVESMGDVLNPTGKILQAEPNQSKSIASVDSKLVESMGDVLNLTGKFWQAEPNQTKSIASADSKSVQSVGDMVHPTRAEQSSVQLSPDSTVPDRLRNVLHQPRHRRVTSNSSNLLKIEETPELDAVEEDNNELFEASSTLVHAEQYTPLRVSVSNVQRRQKMTANYLYDRDSTEIPESKDETSDAQPEDLEDINEHDIQDNQETIYVEKNVPERTEEIAEVNDGHVEDEEKQDREITQRIEEPKTKRVDISVKSLQVETKPARVMHKAKRNLTKQKEPEIIQITEEITETQGRRSRRRTVPKIDYNEDSDDPEKEPQISEKTDKVTEETADEKSKDDEQVVLKEMSNEGLPLSQRLTQEIEDNVVSSKKKTKGNNKENVAISQTVRNDKLSTEVKKGRRPKVFQGLLSSTDSETEDLKPIESVIVEEKRVTVKPPEQVRETVQTIAVDKQWISEKKTGKSKKSKRKTTKISKITDVEEEIIEEKLCEAEKSANNTRNKPETCEISEVNKAVIAEKHPNDVSCEDKHKHKKIIKSETMLKKIVGQRLVTSKSVENVSSKPTIKSRKEPMSDVEILEMIHKQTIEQQEFPKPKPKTIEIPVSLKISETKQLPVSSESQSEDLFEPVRKSKKSERKTTKTVAEKKVISSDADIEETSSDDRIKKPKTNKHSKFLKPRKSGWKMEVEETSSDIPKKKPQKKTVPKSFIKKKTPKKTKKQETILEKTSSDNSKSEKYKKFEVTEDLSEDDEVIKPVRINTPTVPIFNTQSDTDIVNSTPPEKVAECPLPMKTPKDTTNQSPLCVNLFNTSDTQDAHLPQQFLQDDDVVLTQLEKQQPIYSTQDVINILDDNQNEKRDEPHDVIEPVKYVINLDDNVPTVNEPKKSKQKNVVPPQPLGICEDPFAFKPSGNDTPDLGVLYCSMLEKTVQQEMPSSPLTRSALGARTTKEEAPTGKPKSKKRMLYTPCDGTIIAPVYDEAAAAPAVSPETPAKLRFVGDPISSFSDEAPRTIVTKAVAHIANNTQQVTPKRKKRMLHLPKDDTIIAPVCDEAAADPAVSPDSPAKLRFVGDPISNSSNDEGPRTMITKALVHIADDTQNDGGKENRVPKQQSRKKPASKKPVDLDAIDFAEPAANKSNNNNKKLETSPQKLKSDRPKQKYTRRKEVSLVKKGVKRLKIDKPKYPLKTIPNSPVIMDQASILFDQLIASYVDDTKSFDEKSKKHRKRQSFRSNIEQSYSKIDIVARSAPAEHYLQPEKFKKLMHSSESEELPELEIASSKRGIFEILTPPFLKTAQLEDCELPQFNVNEVGAAPPVPEVSRFSIDSPVEAESTRIPNPIAGNITSRKRKSINEVADVVPKKPKINILQNILLTGPQIKPGTTNVAHMISNRKNCLVSMVSLVDQLYSDDPAETPCKKEYKLANSIKRSWADYQKSGDSASSSGISN